ncbi:MAG: hypothetical protein JNL85_06875 [Rubrivivax sp.]|nr:hypothetical protein [Rubrivivax sp.]
MSCPPRKPRGVTLVELAGAIGAIAGAAALALPHLGNPQREQRAARLLAARAAVQSAAALLHGVAQAQQAAAQPSCRAPGFGTNPPAVGAAGDGNLCTDAARVQVTRLYPAPTLAGIVAAAGLVPVIGTPTPAQLAHDGFEVRATSDGLQIRLAGGSDAAACAFVYRAPAALGQAPEVSPALTAGC